MPRPDDVPARLGRFVGLDARAVNLDGFSKEDHDAGLVAFASANDPEPSVEVDAAGRITELDGVAAADFDLIDAFIAAHGIDAAVAGEAGRLDDVEFARLIVDPGTPREDVVRLARGVPGSTMRRANSTSSRESASCTTAASADATS